MPHTTNVLMQQRVHICYFHCQSNDPQIAIQLPRWKSFITSFASGSIFGIWQPGFHTRNSSGTVWCVTFRQKSVLTCRKIWLVVLVGMFEMLVDGCVVIGEKRITFCGYWSLLCSICVFSMFVRECECWVLRERNIHIITGAPNNFDSCKERLPCWMK